MSDHWVWGYSVRLLMHAGVKITACGTKGARLLGVGQQVSDLVTGVRSTVRLLVCTGVRTMGVGLQVS